jgi:superfamily II DNA/RNA helicase
MDLPDIQVVVQWWASCNLMTLWQRLGRGARDRTCTATAIFLVEKEHFDEQRKKKRQRVICKTKKQNTPLQSITNKRVRTESSPSTSQRTAVDNVEAPSGSSDETESEGLTSMALGREDENSNKRETDLKISQLRHHYSTTIFAPRKKRSDPLEPAMDVLINARSRSIGCRRIPVQAYLEMNDVCMCRSSCQLVGVINCSWSCSY